LEDEKDIKQGFIETLKNSIKESIFVKLTLGKFRGQENGPENIYIIPVKLKNEIKYSFRYKHKTKDLYKNFDSSEAVSEIENELGKNYLTASLFTTHNDIIIEYSKRRIPRTYTRKASFTRVEVKEHNRIKTRYVDSKEKYLNLLGLTNAKGEVRGEKYDKFRQIDKFIEIVNSLFNESTLADRKEITVTDFGSGKSYLTFALYDYFNNRLGIKTTVTGVEQRNDLAVLSNNIAAESEFGGLKFMESAIDAYKGKSSDIVIALHACDTATDDAISKALKMKAGMIILAPCCQKYIRKQINIPADLNGVFKHGILEEHFSSFITDGLRALVLESYGYNTKVFEFISGEHTSKNIMITAVKGEYSEDNYLNKVLEIEKLKSKFGLKDFYLDKLLTKTVSND
jgi:Methyltransferase domain